MNVAKCSSLVIKKLMEEKNISISDLVMHHNSSKQRISHIMNYGIGSISGVYKIAKIFGVTGSGFLKRMENIQNVGSK